MKDLAWGKPLQELGFPLVPTGYLWATCNSAMQVSFEDWCSCICSGTENTTLKTTSPRFFIWWHCEYMLLAGGPEMRICEAAHVARKTLEEWVHWEKWVQPVLLGFPTAVVSIPPKDPWFFWEDLSFSQHRKKRLWPTTGNSWLLWSQGHLGPQISF